VATGGSRTADELAGSVYVDLIHDQLVDEDARKTSCEQRGITVITTSAALASLLFGLTSVVTRATHTSIPEWARNALYGALGFFALAAVAAIFTNLPLAYKGINTDDLRKLVERPHWEGPKPQAARGAAKAHLDQIDAARAANNLKARALQIALILEVAAVISVAISVALIIASPPPPQANLP
jgi:hypothetical protein